MGSTVTGTGEARFLTPEAVRIWRVVQVAVWLVGAWIFAALVLWPDLGLHAFWNVLIPVAPALLALFGFAPHPGDGMLVDLRGTLPAWFPWVSRTLTTALVAWWFLARLSLRRAWAVRPEYA